MATLTFTVPDDKLPELVDALCALPPPYSATLPNGTANPETRGQFARQRVIGYMKAVVISYRRQQAEAGIDAVEPNIT